MKLQLRKPPTEPSGMNETETAFYQWAKLNFPRFEYEALTFVLADGLRYTPDFYAVDSLGGAHLYEVKRGWSGGKMATSAYHAKSRAKLKMAARLFPEFHWHWAEGTKATKKNGGGWTWKLQEIKP